MQKRLMIIAVLLLAICNKIAAADQLTISEFSIFTGQTKDVSISLTNDKAYAAFQFDLVLPEGVTVVMPESPKTWNDHKSDRIPSTTDLDMQQLSDGSYRFVVMPGTTTIENISGSEGVIINLTLSAAATAAVGNQTGYFRNIKLSTSDGVAANGNTISEQSFTFTTRGDEAYAVLSDENTKLTFYYDKLKDTSGAMEVGPFSNSEDRGWENAKETITTVVFDDSFANCLTLTSTAWWFDGFSNLATITNIANLKTDNVTSMIAMFQSCSSLISIDLSRLNTSKVTDMRYMFRYCPGVTNIDVSKFNTASVKLMDGMFGGCTGLTSIDLSGLNTTNVEGMNSLFGGCTNLTSINLTGLNTASLTDMGFMFDACPNLTSIDLSSFNTSQVNVMHYLFRNCPNLKTIYVSSDNWSTEAISIELYGNNMFIGCTSLVGGAATVYDDAHTDYTYAHIDGGTSDPGYFTDVQYKDADAEPYALVTGNDEKTLTFYYDNRKEARNGFGVGPFQETSQRWGANGDYVTTVVFDDSFADCNTITSTAYWFSGFKNLTSIEGLDKLNTASVNTMQAMFYGCNNLPELDVTHFNTENVTNMALMFYACEKVEMLDISSFNTAKVTSMDDMFSECPSLKTIYAGNLWKVNLSELVMFQNCTSLVGGEGTTFTMSHVDDSYARIDEPLNDKPGYFTDINDKGVARPYAVYDNTNTTLTFYYDANQTALGGMTIGPFKSDSYRGWTTKAANITNVVFDDSFAEYTNVKSTAYWFSGCNKLTKFTGLSNLITSGVNDMSSMFLSCESLTELDLSNFVTQDVTNMSSMFYGCSNLANVIISGFNTEQVTDMYGMFYGCMNLTSLDLSSFDTQNVTNMSNMFYGDTELTTIYVSDKWTTGKMDEVTSTSTDMFYACSVLVGGEGTTYDSNNVSYTYARIDDPANGKPGYFTDVAELGKEPYAVLSEDGSGNWTLTFCYDENKTANNGMSVGPFSKAEDAGWYDKRQNINQVTFENSFAGCTNLTSTAYWFYGFKYLTSINGLDNLNTTSVNTMQAMFYGCNNLPELDVTHFNTEAVTNMALMFYACEKVEMLDISSFNTANVTTMEDMFSECPSLKTIYAGILWKVNQPELIMFQNCASLVGGEGTPFSMAHANDEYARIDDPANDKPGYFTDVKYKGVENEPYAVLSDENKTLTFYYDKKKEERGGMSVGPFNAYFDRGWETYRDGITSIVIDESMASCTTLTSTAWWFDGCYNAAFTGLNKLNTANVVNMHSMFSGCSFTSVDLSSFDTQNVTDMSDMFYQCTALTSLDLSNFKTHSVTSMENMFKLCRALASITIDKNNFKTDNVEDMSEMFNGCNVLTSIDVSGFNTPKVTDMERMFSSCMALTSLDLSSFNTSSVTNMTDIFSYTNISSLDLGSFNTSSVTSMYQMFAYNSKLETIYVGENWNTTLVTSDGMMFQDCTKLVGGEGTVYSADNVGKAYAHIDGGTNNPGYFTNVIYKGVEDEPYAVISAEHTTLYFYYDKKKEERNGMSIVPFESINGTTETDRGWEEYKADIDKVVFDYSFVDCNSITSTALWFSGFSKLTKITNLGYLNTENVTDMSNMFYGCTSLTSLDVTSFNTEKVTNMSYMFYGCSALTSLDVSRFNTSSVQGMGGMFTGCSSLTSLDVSRFNTENVGYMWMMFANCTQLASLDVSKFNTSNVIQMHNMFTNCSSLQSLDITGFDTSNTTRMESLFSGCSELTTIYAGSGWTTKLISSDDVVNMFNRCTKLVGGKGTVYDANHIDYTYARIDGGPSSETPGYFTDINAPASYEVKVRAVGNGQVTIDRVVVSSNNEEIVTVDRGSAITMVFTPDEGYKLESVVVDNTDVTSELEAYNETGAKIYTLDRIYDYHKVTATFANNTVTLTAKSYTRKYGEENPEFEYTTEGADFSGKPTITCEATDTTSVGTYPIVITYTEPAGTRAAIATDETSSLNVVCVNGTLTITKTPLKVAAKSYTIKRGSPIPTFEIEYAGFVNNETETVFTKKAEATCEAKSDTVPGTYQIVVSGAEAKNYEMEFVNGSLTITDDVVVTAKSYTREYGEANPTFEYTVDGAILEGTPTITCEATATSPVGTYDITIAKGDITNSDVTYVKGTLTITKAPLTITAKSYSIKQGKDLPTLELEYSGFKNNETDTVFTTKPTVTTRATSYSNPGTYDIIVSGAEAANYEIKYVNGNLTITEKTESFDGYVLRVNEGGNIDDAFENMGGREEAAKTIAAIIWNASDLLTDEMLEGIDNPNLLVYVSDKKHAPKNVKNVVVGGEAQYISLTDDSTKNCNFYVPEEFVADSIVYTREFKQTTKKNVSRGWEGIVLPFTVQTFSHETHGEIAPFGNTASKYHFWLHAITEDGVIDATTIEANKPYIISMPNSEEYTAEFNQAGLVTFASADVKVPATETMDVWLGDSVVIIPTLQRVEKYDMIYALNVLYDFDDYKEGSVFVSNYRDIRPFEIYTFHERHHHEGAGARFISLSSLFGGSDNTTGIIPSIDVDQNGEVWFDMNGRRLQSKPARKGVYIMNGKKVVIK